MRRLAALAACGLAAAGSAAASSGTDAPVTAATIATFPPTTTTATTDVGSRDARPPSPTDDRVDPSIAVHHARRVPDLGRTPSTPTTIAPPTSGAAGVRRRPGPAVPDATHPIDAAWPDPATSELQSVADGTYWATVRPGTATAVPQFVTFRLTQAFFGEACTAQFGADGCDNDIGTLEEPSGTMPMFIGGELASPSPTRRTQQSYADQRRHARSICCPTRRARARSSPATSTSRSRTCCTSRVDRSSAPSRSGPRSPMRRRSAAPGYRRRL